MSPAESKFRQQFFHGTSADLMHGDLIVPGYTSNLGEGKPLSWVYCVGTLDAAICGAELAAGDGRQDFSGKTTVRHVEYRLADLIQPAISALLDRLEAFATVSSLGGPDDTHIIAGMVLSV